MDPDLVRAIREGFLTVTLTSSGGRITFARGSEFRILDGVEGFGPAPVEYTSTPLPGGGGVRRHSRHAENSLFLPVELRGSSPDHLRRLRRELEGVILADGAGTAVTVQVEDDAGVRTQEAFLDGEGHSYSLGGAASHFTWHKIGLTLTAPVPWWFGPQREESWSLSPKRTAWLSRMQDEPGDGTLAVPFGRLRLSESTVQGATSVQVAGDADAEAVLIIDGPGEDLEVVNETTSQRIFITGDIDETLTIDSRGGWQDIYSDSMRDGEWWARVNEDAPEELITLAPGQNLIRVTMVNAHPQSKVRLLYRETYRAGH